MKLINAILIAWGLILAAATARAGPMGFEGSWMSMGDLGENWRDVWVNYALTPRDAIGGGYLYMCSDDKRTTRELQKSPTPGWCIAGICLLPRPISGLSAGSAHCAVVDPTALNWPTRLGCRPILKLRASTSVARHGCIARPASIMILCRCAADFLFYEAEYDETQPWFVLEACYMRHLSDKVEVTPMLRLVNKKFFIEGGVSNNRDVRFNFMYIF